MIDIFYQPDNDSIQYNNRELTRADTERENMRMRSRDTELNNHNNNVNQIHSEGPPPHHSPPSVSRHTGDDVFGPMYKSCLVFRIVI